MLKYPRWQEILMTIKNMKDKQKPARNCTIRKEMSNILTEGITTAYLSIQLTNLEKARLIKIQEKEVTLTQFGDTLTNYLIKIKSEELENDQKNKLEDTTTQKK